MESVQTLNDRIEVPAGAWNRRINGLGAIAGLGLVLVVVGSLLATSKGEAH